MFKYVPHEDSNSRKNSLFWHPVMRSLFVTLVDLRVNLMFGGQTRILIVYIICRDCIHLYQASRRTFLASASEPNLGV